MEIEKNLIVGAAPAQVWALLLDPNVMGGCVPGMQSIEVVSDVEYISHIQVKIAFVSARFKIKTTIVEMRAPNYLRSEGTGEDASVASSLKQSSEIFLTGQPDGKTELRMKINVDVLGRLGTFGLSVMKTKADRMWEEFGTNLSARLVAPAEAAPAAACAAPAAADVAQTVAKEQAPSPAAPGSAIEGIPARPAVIPARTVQAGPNRGAGWWSRLFSPAPAVDRGPLTDICIEVRQPNATITVRWPAQHAGECAAWLRDYLK
ncbi:CoxG family protein [Cupriavidus basilensis]|uniref:Carbon monoxide oxidation accessory protein CoxG n=1 Tax=Cupriavidus basilensis TaxID=68895 RepID=A0A0C4Y4B8_9BURK|nr:SRPBCC domain-containing protein [Cupriavidus basilensis]AJG20142.1 Carbon monoxide oxidation accessory protein CoxG [Cupriavidus basilensis]